MPVEIAFTFSLPDGLHARPAGIIQEKAESFASEATWENSRTGARADAKSVLALIGTDTLNGDPCRIVVRGPDEEAAARSLRDLIENELPRREAEAAEAPPAAAADVPRVLPATGAVFVQGAPAGPGVARAPVVPIAPEESREGEALPAGRPPDEERALFSAAAAALEAELKAQSEAARVPAERAVLRAHLAIVRDRAFAARVHELIAGGLSAAGAVASAARFFGERLQASRSAYLRERLADIRDIARRLVSRLGAAPETGGIAKLAGPSILAAGDLTPSQFLALDPSLLKGLILENAGTTSHTLILCRAREIPAVTGTAGLLGKLIAGEEAVVDGGRGIVVLAPGAEVVRYYDREMRADERRRERRRSRAGRPAVTVDGRRIEVAANIGHPEELGKAWAEGAEGVGLFRTELLLLDRTEAPGEEEQYEVYARAAREAGGRPIIIRTFDIGGDKPIPYLPLPKEANPFLGARGIRLYPAFADLVRAQLRAIHRAAVHGPLKIMAPMVAAVEEVLAFKETIRGIRAGLAAEGVPHRPDVEFGIMVEVPSAALLVDRLAEHVDFFSVGSNDLLQYAFAADRGNPAVRPLARARQPAFLRLLRTAVAGARGRGKWIGLCGELAGSARDLPLLVGLGFDELSMSAASIPGIKAAIRALDAAACRGLAENAAECSTIGEVDALVESFAAAGEAPPLTESALVGLHSDSRSRAEAIQEFAAMMEEAGRVDARADLERALWQREDTFSTGIGFGTAIPHGQCPALRSAAIAFLRFETPIDWHSADGEPVDMALMLAIPAGGGGKEHLKLLARLSRRLMHDEFRASLRAARDEAAVAGLISAAVAD